ncbi:AAA family ATPase [Candidatus Nomurabacteria bacterium]|nr:AAA family ATPase [Candidatus Nomurabacteria bacterium]
MVKNLLITISGTPGSGKSTIAEILSKKLKAKRIYVGGIRRDLARKKGMTLEQLNEYALIHPETDVEVDETAAKEARQLNKETNVIVEGRTQFHFLPESIKIYIKVDLAEGAKRIWQQIQNSQEQAQRNEGLPDSIEGVIEKLQERQKSDKKRYKKYYNLDHTDLSQYDLVIDTTKISAEDGAQEIIDFLENKA